MQIFELEPFAYGYYHSEGKNAVERIADGMYAQCAYMPLTIDPEIKLASVDRAVTGFIENRGVTYIYGDGIVYKEENFDKEIEAYPEFADELRAYKAFFEEKNTYTIFRNTFSPLEKRLIETNTLWGGTWGGHSNPDYGMLLGLGTAGLREKIAKYAPEHEEAKEWYNALTRVLDGIDILGDRFRKLAETLAISDMANADIYKRIAKAFETIPKQPADDFVTAMQFFYFAFTLDGKDSPGIFDRYMYPYYNGCDKKEVRELLEGMWIGFNKTRSWNLCIGGSDENNNDLSNELTWEILDIAEKFHYNTPNLTMRIHSGTPDKLLHKAAEVIGTGIGMPALYNDDVVCPALEELGIPKADSHLYAMNGCNQIDIQGKSHMGLEDGEVCLLKCLEFALFNGKNLLTGEKLGIETGDAKEFKTFDELYSAYKKQVENALEITVRLANRSQGVFSEHAPNPLRSLLIQGCIEKGRDYKTGGPIYNHGQILTEGLADTTDSLMAIKHFVFDTKQYTIAQILEALESDYEGCEDIRKILNDYDGKFGNDIDEVDELGGDILKHFFTEMKKYRTFRDPVNGIYGGGLSTFQRTGRYGSSCGASANGRHAKGVNIADSIGPTPGKDVCGPTAVINSALKYDQKLAKSGFVLQLKFDKTLFNTPKGLEGFTSLVRAYFGGGGQQMSINVLDKAELLDAKAHPENHKNLIVRVGGYSDLFVNLSDALKENVIARTMQEL